MGAPYHKMNLANKVLYLLSRVRVSRSTCWNWQGQKKRSGYGYIFVGRKKISVHRISWSLFNEKEIPVGALVLHGCDNSSCCNPEHLRLGDPKMNSQDREERERGWNKRKTHCNRGHKYTLQNTYFIPGRRCRVCRKCRRMFEGKHRPKMKNHCPQLTLTSFRK